MRIPTSISALLQNPGGATIVQPSPPALLGQGEFSAEGVPLTCDAVESMRGQRSELSDQLTSVSGRREDLAEELLTAPPAQKAQLEARLKQLDDRILGIETEIARTGALIARGPGTCLVGSSGPDLPPFANIRSPNTTAIGVVLTLFVFAQIAISIARLVWRRGSNPVRPVIDQEQSERLRRLEGNVDAIALEIERISEGQRFVTKLLADREIKLEVTPKAQELLAREGYDRDFGARPLKRVLQRQLADPLASRVLAGELGPGDTAVVDAQAGKLIFTGQRAGSLGEALAQPRRYDATATKSSEAAAHWTRKWLASSP